MCICIDIYCIVPLPATKNNQIQSQDIVGVVPELGLPSNSPGGQEGDGKGPEPHEGVELYIGLSLVIGFVFMLVIDQLSPAHTHQESGWCELASGNQISSVTYL